MEIDNNNNLEYNFGNCSVIVFLQKKIIKYVPKELVPNSFKSQLINFNWLFFCAQFNDLLGLGNQSLRTIRLVAGQTESVTILTGATPTKSPWLGVLACTYS